MMDKAYPVPCNVREGGSVGKMNLRPCLPGMAIEGHCTVVIRLRRLKKRKESSLELVNHALLKSLPAEEVEVEVVRVSACLCRSMIPRSRTPPVDKRHAPRTIQ